MKLEIDFESAKEYVENYYSKLKEQLHLYAKRGKIQEALNTAVKALWLQKKFHFSWKDIDLEEILIEIYEAIGGNRLPLNEKLKSLNNSLSYKRDKNRPKIAYILSVFYDYGGHSVHSARWIRALKSFADVTLIITGWYPTDKSFRLDALKKDVKVVEIPYNLNFLEKIKYMTTTLYSEAFDVIISAANSDDLITFYSLWNIKKNSGETRIFYFLHDNFSPFWIGQSFIEEVISPTQILGNYIEYYQKKLVNFIPLINGLQEHTLVDCLEIRKNLKILKKFKIVVTATSSHKILPFMNQSFAELIEIVLTHFRDIYILLIISSQGSSIWKNFLSQKFEFIKQKYGRVDILKASPNLGMFFNCADVLVDSYPIYGGGVIIDALPYKINVLSHKNNEVPFISGDTICKDGIVSYDDYSDFTSKLDLLLRDPEYKHDIRRKCAEIYSYRNAAKSLKNSICEPYQTQSKNKTYIESRKPSYNKLYLFALRWNLFSYDFLLSIDNFKRGMLQYIRIKD